MAPNVEKTEEDTDPNIKGIFPKEKTYKMLRNEKENVELKDIPLCEKRKYRYSKLNLIAFSYYYLGGIYGLYRLIFYARFYTVLYSAFLTLSGVLGVSVGVHRYWSHRSFKAKAPLRLLLLLMFSLSGQNSVANWVRDHKVHHLYSDTDADPHNARRGIFFSQVGWLLVEKHPAVKACGKPLSIKYLYDDKLIAFHQKHSVLWLLVFTYILPTLLPMVLWQETLRNAWYVATIFRFLCIYNFTALVNSVAHMYGDRPYDSKIAPTEHWLIGLFTFGDGYHNYHHVFPWDYRGSEPGPWSRFSISTWFIDFFAWLGWAYDLKSVSREHIVERAIRTGDGTRNSHTNKEIKQKK